MKKPILLIMAAGLGSRYGGLKQIAPVDDAGHILMDYSIFDARRAGFETVVCVIAPGMEADFRGVIGDRIARYMEVRYAFQRPDTLPEGFAVPQGRTKPWGTAHAVLSAKEVVDAPFAVINADDYYGVTGFQLIHDFLVNKADSTRHAMVGYSIENTLTENGHVARGVCRVEGGLLREITERTQVEPRPGGAAFVEGESETFLPAGTVVSMNLWGFGYPMMEEIEARFPAFLREQLPVNPLKSEYFLPLVPGQLLAEGKARVEVLPTPDKWYGVTYAADMPVVRRALGDLTAAGTYPEPLWQ